MCLCRQYYKLFFLSFNPWVINLLFVMGGTVDDNNHRRGRMFEESETRTRRGGRLVTRQ